MGNARGGIGRAGAGTTGGYVSLVQYDTGIFYSRDSRTAYSSQPSVNPSGTGPSTPISKWDYDQVSAFGISNNSPLVFQGNTPLYCTTSPSECFGTGSPVAGPDTLYTHDFNSALSGEARYSGVGPWRRIKYDGSRISCLQATAGGTCAPVASVGSGVSTNIIPTSQLDLYSKFTTNGFVVSTSSPLPR